MAKFNLIKDLGCLLLSNIPVEEHESIQELTLKPFEARIYSLN